MRFIFRIWIITWKTSSGVENNFLVLFIIHRQSSLYKAYVQHHELHLHHWLNLFSKASYWPDNWYFPQIYIHRSVDHQVGFPLTSHYHHHFQHLDGHKKNYLFVSLVVYCTTQYSWIRYIIRDVLIHCLCANISFSTMWDYYKDKISLKRICQRKLNKHTKGPWAIMLIYDKF